MYPDNASFAERADLSEWMDEPCTYEEFRDCLRDLAAVNRFTLAHRATLAFLEEVIAKHGTRDRPLRIVDVGSGGGDMLRAIARRAKLRGWNVLLLGIDLNPHAARAAAEFSKRSPQIEWRTGDVFALPMTEQIDVVISSLLTHHLREVDIVHLLAWMEARAACGWFINDLYRSSQSHRLFGWMARLFRWHRFVQHDGPVSIQRSFREADWTRMLRAAAIPEGAVAIRRVFPARLCVGRLR